MHSTHGLCIYFAISIFKIIIFSLIRLYTHLFCRLLLSALLPVKRDKGAVQSVNIQLRSRLCKLP